MAKLILHNLHCFCGSDSFYRRRFVYCLTRAHPESYCLICQYIFTFFHVIGQSKMNQRLPDITSCRMLLDVVYHQRLPDITSCRMLLDVCVSPTVT